MRCAKYYIANKMSSRKPFLEFNKSSLFVKALYYIYHATVEQLVVGREVVETMTEKKGVREFCT
jgi:hypothetical protein